MKVLIVNSVLKKLSITVLADRVDTISLPSEKHHNENILVTIDKILKNNNLKLKDFDYFACFVGPGSFTGIRVGIATIKAFALAYNTPVVGINTLEYIAKLCPLNDAVCVLYGSMNSFFVAKKCGDQLEYCNTNVTREQLLQFSPLPKFMLENEFVADFDAEYLQEDSNVLASLVIEKIARQEGGDLSPVYCQLSQAERQKSERELIIRNANKTDIQDIVDIDKEVFSEHWNNDVYNEEFSSERNIYVATIDDKIIGYIDLAIYPDEESIMRVGVKKDYQRTGIATRLIEFSQQNSTKEIISLEVSVDNSAAIALYMKLGFGKRRVRKHYYANGKDCIEMTKSSHLEGR